MEKLKMKKVLYKFMAKPIVLTTSKIIHFNNVIIRFFYVSVIYSII